MRFHAIRPATAWAMLCMEGAVAVVPAYLLSTPWLLALLPVGYVLAPRAHRWRRVNHIWLGVWLSIAIWAAANYGALLAGSIGVGRVVLWWMTGVVPVLLGAGLWWRGVTLAQTEIGAHDVRTEFAILGGVSLTAVVMLRGLVNPPTPLVAGAGLVFVASGLLALGLARQDAAQAQRSSGARTLAGLSAAAPTAGGVVLAGILTPALVAALWTAFGSVLQVLLTPFMLLLQWLASLIPRFGAGAGLPPGFFNRQPLPDLSELQRQAAPPAWLAWVILGVFALMAIALVAVVIRVLLVLTGAPREAEGASEERESDSDTVGSARKDAGALLGWLWAWLRRRLLGTPGGLESQPGRGALDPTATDAREAYRALLAWARTQGLARHDAETTQQFRHRLEDHAPDAAASFDLITDVYEWDRYGHKPTPRDRLSAVRRHLQNLVSRGA